MPNGKPLDSKLAAEGAEFMMTGLLLIEEIQPNTNPVDPTGLRALKVGDWGDGAAT